MSMFIDVVTFKNVINLDKLFTYEVDFPVSPGDFVLVDFNGSLEIALTLRVYSSEDSFDAKMALQKIEEIKPLEEKYLELGIWMKEFYILTYAKAFSTICDFTNINNLSYKYTVKNLIPDEVEELVDKLNSGKSINKEERSLLDTFIEKNHIILEPSYSVITGEEVIYYKFNLSIEESLDIIRKNSTRQIDLTNAIFEKFYKMNFFSTTDLKDVEEYDKSVFNELIKKKIFVETTLVEKEWQKSNISLTAKQEDIVSEIKSSQKNKFLIRGVTGSGKTEMYFNLIEDVLSRGKNAIFLVPEIGLTPQMELRTRERFGDLISIIHSKLSRKKRITEIEKIQLKKSRILLGTRSAIFVQVPDLELIIIDEEHDDSYKLDGYNKYDVREVARFLTENTPKSKLVLGSATPSMETYYKAKLGVYDLFVIEERPENVEMPKVSVVDMREELKSGNTTPFSLELMASMKESLNKNKQVLLFLNRRGYSTFVTCRSCGYTAKCHRCDISMVYHKNNNLLRCHYCGHMESSPRICPSCGSKNIKLFGMGTEKLEEETKNLFPDFEIIRIDSDTTSKHSEYEDNVKRILNDEVSVIIGTQMISKGFDFPNIDMVGVIASDLSLNIPEYDAAEKTFQLVMQVAGRSGRSKERGNVVVQTYNPDHYAMRRAINHDYEGFFVDELKIRKAFSYPPFRRQYIITILNRDFKEGMDVATKFYDYLEEEIINKGFEDFTELVSQRDRLSISRLNNRYHINILLNSSIKEEKFIKNLIYDIFIRNKYKVNLSNTHVDVVSR